MGQVPASDGAKTWRIEFGTATELKISVRDACQLTINT
jgi:hypothetical protein